MDVSDFKHQPVRIGRRRAATFPFPRSGPLHTLDETLPACSSPCPPLLEAATLDEEALEPYRRIALLGRDAKAKGATT